jgi:hypothetical protein
MLWLQPRTRMRRLFKAYDPASRRFKGTEEPNHGINARSPLQDIYPVSKPDLP